MPVAWMRVVALELGVEMDRTWSIRREGWKGSELKLSRAGRWHFYEVKHWIFFDRLDESEVYVSQTKAKAAWRKKFSGGTGLLMVFKTPRENRKDQDENWSHSQLQCVKVIRTTNATVIASLFMLTRSLMKFYSISRVQTSSRFHS